MNETQNKNCTIVQQLLNEINDITNDPYKAAEMRMYEIEKTKKEISKYLKEGIYVNTFIESYERLWDAMKQKNDLSNAYFTMEATELKHNPMFQSGNRTPEMQKLWNQLETATATQQQLTDMVWNMVSDKEPELTKTATATQKKEQALLNTYSISFADGYFCETFQPSMQDAQAFANKEALRRGTQVESVKTRSQHLADIAAQKKGNLPLSQDKDVCKIVKYLQNNGMESEARHLQSIVAQTDQMGELLAKMEAMQGEIKQLTKSNLALQVENQKLQQQVESLESRLCNSYRYTGERLKERMTVLKSGYANTKAGIRDFCEDAVIDFKVNGKAALGRISEALNISGKLNWMSNCVANGISEMKKQIDKCERIMTGLNEMADNYAKMYENQSTIGIRIGNHGETSMVATSIKSETQKYQLGLKLYRTIGNSMINLYNKMSDCKDSVDRYQEKVAMEKMQRDDFKEKRATMREDAFAAFAEETMDETEYAYA